MEFLIGGIILVILPLW